MRIIAFSDSHRCTGDLFEAIEQARSAGLIDVCVHCGDGIDDFETAEQLLYRENPHIRLYGACGNCDLGQVRYPYSTVFEVAGVRCMVTHGQPYAVKLGYDRYLYAAHEQGVRVAFFGHTHVPYLQAHDDVTLINPGAICDRRADRPAYAEVVVDDGRLVSARLVNWLT